jgi:uncharacterized membrane protein YhfC
MPLPPSSTLDLGVVFGLAASAAVAIALPPVLGAVVHRRMGASWRYWGLGALVFFVSQVVLRLPWQIPLGLAIARRAGGSVPSTLAWLAASALTAGLFEEVGRWIGYRRFIRRERSFRVGAMYGLGHGGIESIMLVGLPLVGTLVTYVLFARGVLGHLPPAALEALRATFAKLTLGTALLGGVERIFALASHVGLSLIVLGGVVRGDGRWLGAAVALHALLDFGAVAAARFVSPLAGELVAGVFALGAVWIMLRARRVPQS